MNRTTPQRRIAMKYDPESEWALRNGASINQEVQSATRNARESGWLQAVYWVLDTFAKEDMSAETLRTHLKSEIEKMGRGV